MDFIIDNYIWFIIGAIVILMAIVGYIADVTDFGRKTAAKKVKKEKKQKNEENIAVDTPINEISTNIEQENIQDTQIEPKTMFEPINSNENNIFMTQPEVESNELQNNLFNIESKKEENSDLGIDQSLFEPLPNNSNDNQSLSSDDVITTEPINVSVPNEKEIETDDDVWKF